jgi:hypothetical protein
MTAAALTITHACGRLNVVSYQRRVVVCGGIATRPPMTSKDFLQEDFGPGGVLIAICEPEPLPLYLPPGVEGRASASHSGDSRTPSPGILVLWARPRTNLLRYGIKWWGATLRYRRIFRTLRTLDERSHLPLGTQFTQGQNNVMIPTGIIRLSGRSYGHHRFFSPCSHASRPG